MQEKIAIARQKRDHRIRSGCDAVIAGWQCFLEEMLIRLEAFLIPGSLVTFQTLEPDERRLFERLHDSLILPPHVSGVFIPPSVLQGMIPDDYRNLDGHASAGIPRSPSDCGIVLACQHREYRLIINSLLALPPYSPGIDVYAEGDLLAGYAFASVSECQANLQPVIWTYLHTHIDLPPLI